MARQLYASQRNLVIHIISFADTPNGEAVITDAAGPRFRRASRRELATSDAAVERFVLSVFCQDEDVIVLRRCTALIPGAHRRQGACAPGTPPA